AGDLDPELLRRGLIGLRDAEAVRLLVVEDVDLLEAERLRPERVSGALDVVGGDDAGEVAHPGRVVLLRLADVPLLRQARVRVRRAEPEKRTGAVADRDLDLRAPGVERPEHGD